MRKDQTPGQECVFNVAFVIGDPVGACPLLLARGWQCKWAPKFYFDEIHFDFKENMNMGKTYRWFAFAAHSFPWATHIAKMDVDFFPFLHGIADTISPYPVEKFPYEFFGQPILGQGCSPTGVMSQNETLRGRVCMYGGMYMMSYPLAKAITGKGTFWEDAQFGVEDHRTGMAVADFQWTTHKHVQLFPPRKPAKNNTGEEPLFYGVWGWHGQTAMRLKSIYSDRY